jgi:hypothetical protein
MAVEIGRSWFRGSVITMSEAALSHDHRQDSPHQLLLSSTVIIIRSVIIDHSPDLRVPEVEAEGAAGRDGLGLANHLHHTPTTYAQNHHRTTDCSVYRSYDLVGHTRDPKPAAASDTAYAGGQLTT